MRREPALAALLCLVGAFLVLVAAANPWVRLEVLGTAVVPGRTVEVVGSELAPGVRALGLVALAGVVAVAATRSWGRVVVGVLLLAVGVGVAGLALGTDTGQAALEVDSVRDAGPLGDVVDSTPWPLAAAVGGLVIATAGAFVALRGRRWAALGRRYEAPAARAAAPPVAPERALWEALDRGEDPTGAAPRSDDDQGRIA